MRTRTKITSVNQYRNSVFFIARYKARKCEKANHFLPSYIFLLEAMKLNLHKKRYGVAINLRFHMIFEKKKDEISFPIMGIKILRKIQNILEKLYIRFIMSQHGFLNLGGMLFDILRLR